ncbi:unnamed protein product [Brassica rapa]|uniref:Uncharacterized protein n=2 Tax=Brassica TaxID=3705 RepID=A0A8D9HJ66_BRACM|nr:unnamed protein product [Brassica napus]CAG7899499.1 unnamed protein product [Brassica rapa]
MNICKQRINESGFPMNNEYFGVPCENQTPLCHSFS